MSYRDDYEAQRSYHAYLLEELARLEAKNVELAGVQADRARIAAEVARVGRDLEHRRARRSPIRLDNLRVASPCKQTWDSMTGDDRVRDCAKCEKPVFNVSNMTAAEAEELLATRGITACVRFFRRADGTVMTQDCPVGARAQRRSIALAAGLIATATAAAGAVTAFGGDGAATNIAPPPPPIVEELGKMAPPPVDPWAPTTGQPDNPPPPTIDSHDLVETRGAVALPPHLPDDVDLDVDPPAPHHGHKPHGTHTK